MVIYDAFMRKILLQWVFLVVVITSVQSAHADSVLPAPIENQFSVEYGLLRNGVSEYSSETSDSYPGLGIKYARNLVMGLTLDSASVRDSVKLEGGLFLYKVVHFMSSSEGIASTLVFPATLTARYGVEFSEVVELSFYGGVLKNFAIAQTKDSEAAQKALSSWQPSIGLGLAGRIFGALLRFDFGYDSIRAGFAVQY